ncbi:MAG: ATP-binding protein, partial [Rhodothermales bacterium]|nr:ATP-binding protein [Rhodothermales bacterium]
HFYLDRMEHAARRMARLLHDLLEYSRVVTHGSPFEATDLEGAAREALAELEQAGEAGEARVEIEALPEIEADPRQLRSLFRHLFSNAIKFRREGVPPEVHVRAEVERPGVGPALCRLTVQDNGLGFAEKYSERIFMPFERLHGRTTYPGTGMGLAISRRIAERHSGTIAARSTPGEGSVFIVRLPLRQERYGCEA